MMVSGAMIPGHPHKPRHISKENVQGEKVQICVNAKVVYYGVSGYTTED